MNRFSLSIISLLLILPSLSGKIFGASPLHCPADSAKVMELVAVAAQKENYGDKVAAAAKALTGTPFAKAADNDSIGKIVIRLDSLNQREFINMAVAAAKTSMLTAPTLHDFEKYYENVSRRNGVDEGFATQFLYGSDWIVDNVYRGNLREMTEYLDGGSSRTKTLDYVSRHPEEFPAMANPETAEKVRVKEFGYRSHRIPHLKKQSIGNKNVKELLQNGDIIILLSPDTDFDVYDIGIVSFENGEPYLVHIAKDKNFVDIDPYPLPRLFKVEGQFFYGYRWLRPVE